MARALARSSDPCWSGSISTAQTEESLSHAFGVSKRKPRKGWKVLHKSSFINFGIGKSWDSGLEGQAQSERASLSFQSCLRWSLKRSQVDSRPCSVKSHGERISAEAQIGTATDNSRATPLVKSSSKVAGSEPAGSNNGPTKALIADEAATHFKQFETVLTVVGGYDKAVNAEVGYFGPAQSYDNSTWPVLLGLAEVSANKATKGERAAESQLKEMQAQQSAKDASWTVEKAEMRVKLEKMRREEARLEALLWELQQEALAATQSAGPWQGEQAEAEERAWLPLNKPTNRVAHPSASPVSQPPHQVELRSSDPSTSTHLLSGPTAQAAPPASKLQSSPSAFSDAQLRVAERPPLLAAEEGLRRRLSELHVQIASAQGALPADQTPLNTLNLRALESFEKWKRGSSVLSENFQSWRGGALPMLRKGAKQGQVIVAAVVFAVAVAAAGGLVRRAYSHHQEVRIAAAQRAAEEHLREMQGSVVDLNVDNFVPVLTTRPTIVKFYTDWCPYCKRLTPTWEDLAKRVAERGLNVQVARLNADVYSEPVMDLNLKGFPSLVLFEGTKPILNYTGPRDIDALLGVVEASYSQVS